MTLPNRDPAAKGGQKYYRPDDVRARYGVSDMTIRRWEQNPELGFPAPLRINGRRFWDKSALEDFDRRLAEQRA